MGNPTKLPGTGLNVGSYTTMDADGYLYQRGVKITKTAEQINDFVAGTPEDGSITDAKLAPAVKIGNVATLTTTEKTNVVGAINELHAESAAFATKTGAETLTNKTLTDPVCAFTIGAHDYADGAADWTLSAEELLKTVHKPTGASGPVNAIIADTAGIPYVFINGTGQTLTVKTATGSGPTITNGKTAIVMSDGTNVIALAAESA